MTTLRSNSPASCIANDGKAFPTATHGLAASSVTELVCAARDGDEEAWNAIVDRFGGLVTAIARKYHMSNTDVADVVQIVWLQLFTHLAKLREPEALPGWIVTTTTNTCLKVTEVSSRYVPVDPFVMATFHDRAARRVDHAEGAIDENLLREDERRSVRRALDELPSGQRHFLLQTFADPPRAYADISRDLGIPIGSIGPTKARYIQKLRRTAAAREMAA